MRAGHKMALGALRASRPMIEKGVATAHQCDLLHSVHPDDTTHACGVESPLHSWLKCIGSDLNFKQSWACKKRPILDFGCFLQVAGSLFRSGPWTMEWSLPRRQPQPPQGQGWRRCDERALTHRPGVRMCSSTMYQHFVDPLCKVRVTGRSQGGGLRENTPLS